MLLNLHIYQTGIAHESRLIRHCEALKELEVFDDVSFLGSTDGQDQQVTFGSGLNATLITKTDVQQ